MEGHKNYMGRDGFIWFVGVIEDRNDPLQLGRIRVRCLGYHSADLVSIPTADLPWAHVMHPVTDPSMHGLGTTPSFLVEGAWVVGFWRDSVSKQEPIIIGTLPGMPENSANFSSGFNDPRHKESEQKNDQGDKQYAKEDESGKTYNPGSAPEKDLKEGTHPRYAQVSYGPYPLGAPVDTKDPEAGVFGRASGHTKGESDTNRLARNAGHGMIAAKDGAYTKWILLPHSDQRLDEDNPMHLSYGVPHPKEKYVNGGVDLYGNKEKLKDEYLDNAGKYGTMAGKNTGPNEPPRHAYIEENKYIVDKEAHPIPPAGAPESIDASHTADAINPLYYEGQDEYTAEKWNEPRTGDKTKGGAIRYAAVYPYNHVFESESGHIKEYDDTPGSERIHEWHRSGTFYEIDADGTRHLRVVSNNYEVIHGTDFINIKGDVNLTIESNCKTYIKGDWNIQVDGNKYETIKGNSHETVLGNQISLIKGEREETVETNVIETYGTERDKHFHTLLVTGSSNHTVTRNVTETFGTLLDKHYHQNTVVGYSSTRVEAHVIEKYGTDKYVDYRRTTIIGEDHKTVERDVKYTFKAKWTGTTKKDWKHTTEDGNITISAGPNIYLNP